MKAELYSDCGQWSWRIKNNNGIVVAWGRFYSRRNNAKRRLRRFLTKLRVDYVNAELQL